MLGQLFTQFLDHLRYERNVSAHTLRNYESDLRQFIDYLAPTKQEPAGKAAFKRTSTRAGSRSEPDIKHIDHITIREWLSTLHSDHKKKASISRNLPALPPFFTFLFPR